MSKVKLRAETLALIRAKAAMCSMCRRAVESVREDGTLRDWPLGADVVEYPVDAQKYHIGTELRTEETGKG